MMPEVMTTKQACAFLQIERKTLYDLCYADRIPYRRVGRHYRFSRAALEEWVRGEAS